MGVWKRTRGFGRGLFLAATVAATGHEALAGQTVQVADATRLATPSIQLTGVAPPPPGADGRMRYAIATTEAAIRIDGELNDEAWRDAVAVPLPWEVNPAENATAPVLTCM